jgi:hypothetical protein
MLHLVMLKEKQLWWRQQLFIRLRPLKRRILEMLKIKTICLFRLIKRNIIVAQKQKNLFTTEQFKLF